MALKDLVASKASLDEETIEEIVASYVRYDIENQTIFLTPESNKLSSKDKVLIYLVALQGWPFVQDASISVDAKPAEIEEHTGIAGGTLRPVLKELKDRNIIVEKGGRYSVRAVAMGSIKTELGQGNTKRGSAVSARPNAKARPSGKPKLTGTNEQKSAKKTARPSAGGGINDRFKAWIQEGYFNQPKTLSDVQQRFHREAIIIPQTSLPTYLLGGVRSGDLVREKQEIAGKSVWTYTQKGK